MLVLTHNKPLRYELERRSKRLAELPRNLSCTTFFQWAAKCLGEWEATHVVAVGHRAQRVSRLKESVSLARKLSTAFLTDEIGWIKDHRLLTKDLYLERRPRRSRHLASRQPARGNVEAFPRLSARAEGDTDATDWHNIALRFHEAAVVEKSLPFPCFDAVFVDEAQFFAKIVV